MGGIVSKIIQRLKKPRQPDISYTLQGQDWSKVALSPVQNDARLLATVCMYDDDRSDDDAFDPCDGVEENTHRYFKSYAAD